MKTIIIIGAGYAGLSFVRNLSKQAKNMAKFILVDENDFHYKTTQLHKLAASESENVTKALDKILPNNIDFFKARVQKILPNKLLTSEGELIYDELIIAAGASANPFNITGLENAYEIGDYAHALATKKRLDELQDGANVAILGAGFSGAELAGSLARTKNFNIDLIEAMSEILPMYPASLGALARKKLAKVNVLTNHKIKSLENGSTLHCEVDGKMISKDYDAVIFTAGVRGSELLEDSFIPAKGRRVAVDKFLKASSNIYVIGDCAAFMAPNNRPFAPTAQIAAQMGKYLAGCFNERAMNGFKDDFIPSKEFSYFDKGSVCSLGEYDAVGLVAGVKFSGCLAVMLKNFTDLKWDLAIR